MKHVREAGTDAAAVVLFDPGALPADFDQRFQQDPQDLLAELTQDGKAFRADTGGDGYFLLHAYVGEPVPDSLRPYTRGEMMIDRFQAPTGRVYFTGSEYAFRSLDRSLLKSPDQDSRFDVPPGEYRLTFYRMEYPKNLAERRLRSEVSLGAYGLFLGMGALTILSALAALGLVATFFSTPRRVWLQYVLPGLGFLVVLPFLIRRLGPYRDASRRYREIQREFPAYVAWLEPR